MKAQWGYTKNKRELKRIYLSILPTIRKVARECGYAIGVHGSVTRDFDLIAVPWIKKPLKPVTLMQRIELAVCQYPRKEHFHWRTVSKTVAHKAHGRVAYSIYLGRHAYIDLSIISPHQE